MLSQKNYSTIEMVSRIEMTRKAELLNLIQVADRDARAAAPKKNVLNIPAWAPETLLEPSKEMLLPWHASKCHMTVKV
jgi:hypothetical protein